MRRAPVIPRLVARLLDIVEPDAVVGDLEEEYLEFACKERSPIMARVWFWKQVTLTLVVGLMKHATGPDHRTRRTRRAAHHQSDRPQGKRMGTLLKDIHYAVRMLYKTPGLSGVGVLTIALGVALTTHTFSIVYGSVIRGLPYEGADRLVVLSETILADGVTGRSVPLHDYLDWRDQQTVFTELAASYDGTINLADPEQRPERFLGSFVTANFLRVVQVQPILGRAFQDGEDSPHTSRTIVLGYDAWQNRYGGDPNVLGRTVRANGTPHTVIGVMPPGFKFPFDSYLWVPLAMDPVTTARGDSFFLNVFGSLDADATLDQAEMQMASIADRLAEEYPTTNEGVGTLVQPFVEGTMPPQITAVLWLMLVAVFGVLLIACSNVANLLLARATIRGKEVAIRSALGASRTRVIRQLLIEALVLAAVGGGIGVGMGYVGIEIFNAAIVDIQKPYWIHIDLNSRVLLFALGVTLVASLASGIVPALKASGADLNAILKDESKGSSSFRMSRFTNGLVVGEIAVSCGLLIAAGLMVKSIINIKNLDMGFSPANIFTARVGLFETDYPDTASRLQFHDQLVARLEATPGAQSVSLTSNLPASGSGGTFFSVEGEVYITDQDYPVTNLVVATPNLFDTFGVSLLEGRDFVLQDREGTVPVAIVNQSFAARYLSSRSAIGRRIRLGRSETENAWLTVVGVVPDMHVGGGTGGIGSDRQRVELIYLPLAQNSRQFMSIAVATAGAPMAIARDVREVVAAIDPNLPIYNVDSMDGVIETNTWAFGLFGSLFAIFGGIALFMAAVGLYGVMAFSVSRRTQELGIRMALGAHGRDIMRLVLEKGLMQIGIGVAVGLGIGAILGPTLRTVMFDVEGIDLAVYGSIVLTLGIAGTLACVVPARKATRVDLVNALKPE